MKTKKKIADNKLDRIDTFVLSGVITVLLTRGFLYVTNFPELGTDSLHIAHVLLGGVLLVSAFLILLLSDNANKITSALLGGIGFGLFIDEVGKFLTKDSDYFYEPAFTVIYLLYLIIWFISRLLIVAREKEPFLSPAEWPKHQTLGFFIIGWVITQFAAGVIILLIALAIGFDAINDFIGITGFGMLAGLIYAAFLGFGLFRIYRNKLIQAANIIRGSTIFAILGMYPFVFFHYPLGATLGMIITIPITIGLSRVSLVDLLKNLYFKL